MYDDIKSLIKKSGTYKNYKLFQKDSDKENNLEAGGSGEIRTNYKSDAEAEIAAFEEAKKRFPESYARYVKYQNSNIEGVKKANQAAFLKHVKDIYNSYGVSDVAKSDMTPSRGILSFKRGPKAYGIDEEMDDSNDVQQLKMGYKSLVDNTKKFQRMYKLPADKALMLAIKAHNNSRAVTPKANGGYGEDFVSHYISGDGLMRDGYIDKVMKLGDTYFTQKGESEFRTRGENVEGLDKYNAIDQWAGEYAKLAKENGLYDITDQGQFDKANKDVMNKAWDTVISNGSADKLTARMAKRFMNYAINLFNIEE